MLKVIKRDGIIEDFNERKVRTSIENAAKDVGLALNYSDLKVISGDIIKVISNLRKDSQVTSTYEIIGVIISILKKDGFNKTLKAYLDFKK